MIVSISLFLYANKILICSIDWNSYFLLLLLCWKSDDFFHFLFLLTKLSHSHSQFGNFESWPKFSLLTFSLTLLLFAVKIRIFRFDNFNVWTIFIIMYLSFKWTLQRTLVIFCGTLDFSKNKLFSIDKFFKFFEFLVVFIQIISMQFRYVAEYLRAMWSSTWFHYHQLDLHSRTLNWIKKINFNFFLFSCNFCSFTLHFFIHCLT